MTYRNFLRRGDALVLNDAATLPASLRAGPELELTPDVPAGRRHLACALCLGSGDYRVPTEERGVPPRSRWARCSRSGTA